ncbi:ABC transporter ATP-binding protein [Niveibacterium microcysteis]|uniref:ABC transporter ATP-binding protein n=1 Tax=Niveibacterium microcysteis TaxID=2811415 RepID=A0ABX7M571_9RHOO|nr:ABC transporter ATP-binding protein [Niveibacterium microcysteis]QSI76556.1 ABC transporter ATP-binding protein [Niveibacterium microcysteis]
MFRLELKAVVQRYGARTVVNGVDLSLAAGRIACLLGPSGCGKTTLLRCIAGFEPIAGGEICIDGKRVSAPDHRVAAEARQIGMVFQDYALFPHLDVSRNIAFGIRALPAEARAARVAELLQLVGLQGYGAAYPHELSGGQQQRVALARALAPRPQLVLLDEPFSSLDVDLRERIAAEVRDILKREGATALLVTHDQHEAFAMADEVGVMAEGTLRQWDTPYNIYHRPRDRFVADFVGQGAFLPGRVVDARSVDIELGRLRAAEPIVCSRDGALCEIDSQVDLLLRPDDVVHDDASDLRAEVVQKAFRGADILYTLRLASGREVLSLVPSHHNHALGELIGIRLDADHVIAFRSD